MLRYFQQINHFFENPHIDDLDLDYSVFLVSLFTSDRVCELPSENVKSLKIYVTIPEHTSELRLFIVDEQIG